MWCAELGGGALQTEHGRLLTLAKCLRSAADSLLFMSEQIHLSALFFANRVNDFSDPIKPVTRI